MTKLKLQYSKTLTDTIFYEEEKAKNLVDKFYSILPKSDLDDDCNFYDLIEDDQYVKSSQDIAGKFSGKKDFVLVGMGGSSLGPEMLITALGPFENKSFHFLNNSDPEIVFDVLNHIDAEDALFYIVSKSGTTAETMALFSIILTWLEEKGIGQDKWSEYFVFGTDPKQGDLLEIGQAHNISTLIIPRSVGGRYSVLSPVGLFPAAWAGINLEALIEGAKEVKADLDNNFASSALAQMTKIITDLKKNNVNQTVMMPYSSKLRNFSNWFIQLWAESLGKEKNNAAEVVEDGLTPIASYGATDQHSQMQLFMEGPRDKVLFFIEIENFKKNFKLSNNIEKRSLQKLTKYSLAELISAQLTGTRMAFDEKKRPYVNFQVDQCNEHSIGQLIYFFEVLTVLVACEMDINPFDQPGVEAGKVFAFETLAKI